MDAEDRLVQEIERLTDYIVPYLCERTGLSHDQVEAVLDAQEAFWDSNPHVIGRMFVFGFPVGDDGDDVG